MKILAKSANAATTLQDERIFSPNNVVTLLSQIEELRSCRVNLKEQNGVLLLTVGNNEYSMMDKAKMAVM